MDINIAKRFKSPQRNATNTLPALLSLIVALGLWQLITRWTDLPAFIISRRD